MMVCRTFTRLAAAAALSMAAGPALAHPHVWVEMRSDVVFDAKGLISAINLTWSFDDGYQQAALDGLDADGDGDYSEAELAELTKENIASLKDYEFFLRAKLGTDAVPIGEVAEYGQIYSNGKLKLHFTVPLKTPVDPQKGNFYYRVYDPEFFIAMDYMKDQPVAAVGPIPADCKVELLPVVADNQAEETRQMLAEKGKDWQPPPDEDFGAMFAQPVHVACGPAPAAAVTPAAAKPPPGNAESGTKLDKSRLLVPPRNADGSLATTAFTDDPLQWAADKQRQFYGAMRGALDGLKSGAPLAAAWTLMLLSFAYGVLHAAGPGHGKAVVSSWLLATESQLRRGILIAFLSALVQALTAIAIVSVLLFLASNVGSAARDAAGMAESASYALIGVMGLYLIWSVVRPRPLVPAMAGHAHHGHADHVHSEACDHGHAPQAHDMKGDWSLARAASLSFAVGLRPCTGAIAALALSYAIGLYWAGIASTFAMALGTFLTVSIIAACAVYARRLALRFAGRDGRWLGHALMGLKLCGGTIIAALGLLLFWGSLGSSQAMM